MVNYNSLTVVELKKLIKKRGLDVTGRKADLVEALDEYDEKHPDEDGVEEPPKKATKGKRKAKGSEDEEEVEEKPASRKKVKKDDEEEETPSSRSSSRVKAKKEQDNRKEETTGKWLNDGSLYYLTSSSLTPAEKIASFDMDDTLVETKTGKTFATSRNDWQWLNPEVPKKLKELNEQGVRVVIFTNQGGINGKNGFDKTKLGQIEGKIEDLSAELGFALQAFIATTDDHYRKPSTAMWDFMVENCNGAEKPDLENSIFVGDAAGRAAGWMAGRKKDFSCSDRKFAKNIGCKFSTPEEYFLNAPSAEFEWGTFDLESIPSGATGGELTEGGVKTLTATSQEMVLFVGFPASGKSTLARRYMVPAGYVHVNRDTLKTQDKCLKAAKEAVNAGKSVVIDNTNPDPSVRATYIAVAKAARIPCRCFRFEVDEKLANHLNYFRERLGITKHVPRIGYAMYKKNFVEPELSEGFSELKKIQFVKHFEHPDHEKSFEQVS